MNSSPEHIKAEAEASLKRLKLYAINLFYQHHVDHNVPIEDVAGAVKYLIQTGKVKDFGVSEAGANNICRAQAIQPITALQNEYSIWTNEFEKKIIQTLEELGIRFVPFIPLGKDFLNGKMDEHTKFEPTDFINILPRFTQNALKAKQSLIRLLSGIAERKNATPAQIALT